MRNVSNAPIFIRLGRGACVTTIKAESRRLMIERAVSAPGERTSVIFAVNIRNYKLPPPPQNAPGGDQVRLNDREQGALPWAYELAKCIVEGVRANHLDFAGSSVRSILAVPC